MAWHRAFPYRTDNSAIAVEVATVDDAAVLRSDGTWDAFYKSQRPFPFTCPSTRMPTASHVACLKARPWMRWSSWS